MLNEDNLQNQRISRRSFIIGAGKVGLFALLGCRLFYMQFIKKDEYKTLSDKNRIRIIAIPPVRGQIFDCQNNLIAKNNSCFHLFLEKGGMPGYKKEIEFLAEILDLDDEQKSELNRSVRRASYKTPAIIIEALERGHLSIIEERISEFQSIFVDTGYIRYYPYGPHCTHILGYLAKSSNVSEDATPDMTDQFKLGTSGIEKYYNDRLIGRFGHKRLEVNAFGKYVRSISEIESTAGEDIYLGIDAELQQKTQNLLSPQGSSVVLMDCKTGAIKSMNSSPNFDPNEFDKLSQKYWNELITNPYKPLINKSLHSLYPPGSIFKIVVILAALEEGHDPSEKVLCTGGPALGGNSFRCARRSGHGYINLGEAVKGSCNSYIYHLAKEIGADKIIDMAVRLGFGAKTSIDLPNEKSGFVPSKEWKKSRWGSRWTLGDTLNLSIGQGFLLATPLQIVRMISVIASGGKLFTPQILQSSPEYEIVNVDQKHLKTVQSYLYRVVNEPGGTGYRNRIDVNGALMAGKTGTAQVQAKKNAADNLSRQDIAWHRRNHSIFAGYAPFDNPQYAICVYYDHGGDGGRAAAGVAKQVMELALGDRDAR